MRIVKEWSQGSWRFTVFHYQMKYSVKIEDGNAEMIIKLPDSETVSEDKIQKTLDKPSSRQKLSRAFIDLFELRQNILKVYEEEDMGFDEII